MLDRIALRVVFVSAAASVLAALGPLGREARARSDFNGDGAEDFVAATAWEDVAGVDLSGAVHVFYGTPTGGGAIPIKDQYLDALSLGLPIPLTQGLFLGTSSAGGDFDGDGYDDLAISAEGASVAGLLGAGAVLVLRGSPFGLLTSGIQVWTQDSKGVKDQVEGSTTFPGSSDERFGGPLATGDFDADGFADLAIGCSSESVAVDGGDLAFAGSVTVLYGSKKGLRGKRSQLFTRSTPNIPGDPQEEDFFGSAFAVGDFDGNGVDDLAIGVLGNDDVVTLSGAVCVLFGKAKKGLRTKGAVELLESDLAGAGNPQGGFGNQLAAGDFDGDGDDDLVVATPFFSTTGSNFVGRVYVVPGSPTGPDVSGTTPLAEGSGIPGIAQAGDFFGSSVAAADFDDDGFADLAVGAPNEGEPGAAAAGAVILVRGSETGLTAAGSMMLFEGLAGTPDVPEASDKFGQRVVGADLNGDDFADLVVGANGDTIGTANQAGAVFLFYGGAGAGITTAGSQMLDEDNPAIGDAAEALDWFGFYLGK